MPYRIGKTFSFAAGHYLPQLPPEHKCHEQHGHNYTVTVSLEDDVLDETGFILDYAALKPFNDYLQTRLDHKNLNDVLDFHPTAELLAGHLYQVAVQLLGVTVQGVRVQETPGTFAEWVAW